MSTLADSPPIPDVVSGFTRGLSAVLGRRLLGLYLGGSYVMGDFVPESSDYDILVIIEAELSASDLLGIAELHTRLLREHPDARRLEGDYVPLHVLVPTGTLQPVPSFGGGYFEPDQPELMLGADNIANMRSHGIAVLGPPASDVLPPVSPDLVRAAARDMLLSEIDDCGSEADAASELIGRFRSRRSWETGEPSTKSEGVAWAIRQLDPRWYQVIHRADAVRRGAATDVADRTLRDALPELIRLAQAIPRPPPAGSRPR